MDDKSLVSTITGDHIQTAQEDTVSFLRSHTVLADMLDDFRLIGTQSLPQGAPFDFENQAKISFHPFTEAATEIDLAVFFIQRGMYKSFYHHLRSFFELYMVAVYFLSPHRTREETHKWLDGDENTPFLSKLLTALFQEEEFRYAQDRIQLKDRLQSTYWKLCDIIHNKGELRGHKGIVKANFPRFLPETFERAMGDFRECVEIVCVTFALRCPLILIGFPMMEKFGANPPLSGLLDEMESDVIRKYVSRDTLTFLDDFCNNNDYFTSARDWVFSRPDMTQEQITQQLEEMDEFERRFRQGKDGNGANSQSNGPDSAGSHLTRKKTR